MLFELSFNKTQSVLNAMSFHRRVFEIRGVWVFDPFLGVVYFFFEFLSLLL